MTALVLPIRPSGPKLRVTALEIDDECERRVSIMFSRPLTTQERDLFTLILQRSVPLMDGAI